MIKFDHHFIYGFGLGIEYVPGGEEHLPTVLVDLLFLRLMVSWDRVPPTQPL